MASSSSSTTIESSAYDVFLNFRGKDTRYAFVSFLHGALKERGINVFLDSKNLWTGESIGPTLLAAINGSKISIPIFSQHYADSKWCLIELAQIVECHKSNSQLVLPIFFKVNPSNVQNQKKGSFAKAFQEHEKKNLEPQTIEGWRDALKVVGNLKGEVVDDTTDQAKLVDLVVRRVLGELNHNTHLDVCKHPIGIESHVNDLLSLLDFDSNDALLVGILGFGGIGKTTIAKAVYNHIISTFNKHSFISDVREQATQNMGLVSLQHRLLKDILKVDNIDIPNHYAGKQLIQERLCKQKVFIVLDDVDGKEQVDALVGETHWFGQGSRVIITTRDEGILSKAKVDKDKIYRPKELNYDQSLRLFSWHAFTSEVPPKDRMQLSKDVASYSGGLPLTLEVLGSLLSDAISVEEWESTLQSLKEIPPEDVQERLKTSFDKLDNDQKEIFLDAACLFIGQGQEVLTSIWEARGYHPRSAIPILIKRSLIKFENDGFGYSFLKMHDQIRDMGRGIVLRENRTDPSKRSRLWSHDDILQALESNEGTSMVKGMDLSHFYTSFDQLCHNSFEMMPNLEFLDNPSFFKRNFWSLPSLPSKLRWLRLHDDSLDIVPTNFYHRGLVYLKLTGHQIRQAWETIPQDKNKRFQKLKVLNLSGCHRLSKSPNFSWFPNLEHLDLSNCSRLENLDESVGQLSHRLPKLKVLNLSGCHRLSRSPNFSWFPNLEHLDLSFCTDLKILDESIGQLSQLKSLDLLESNQIIKLPNSIGHLKSLVKLQLSSSEIKELPYSISKLSSLEILDLSSYPCKLPDFIGDLQNLVELHLMHTSKDTYEIPDSIGSLENLQVLIIDYKIIQLGISDPTELLKLPRSMGRMRCLHTLDLCLARISELPYDFSMLSNLEVLTMSWTLITKKKKSWNPKSLPVDLSHFNKLRKLELGTFNLLEELPEAPSSLVEFKCFYCDSLVRIFDISRLKRLKVLELWHCPKLKEIQGLEVTESLHRIEVIDCPNMTDTKRNIRGQGKLLLPASTSDYFHLCDDSKGLILCIVFKFEDRNWRKEGSLVSLEFEISATIHQKNKATDCRHNLIIKDIECTSRRDTIYLYHFKGFDWFGIPLQDKDSIVMGKSHLFDPFVKLKFVKLLFQGRELELQEPIDPALMVADFFSWYGPSKTKEEELGSVSEVVEEDEEEEEEELMSRASKRRVHLNANDDI